MVLVVEIFVVSVTAHRWVVVGDLNRLLDLTPKGVVYLLSAQNPSLIEGVL